MLFEEYSLSSIFKNYRQDNNLSLRSFADQVSYSYSYLSKIETGTVIPSKETLISLADKMKVSEYRLLVSADCVISFKDDIFVSDLHLTEEALEEVLKKFKIIPLNTIETSFFKISRELDDWVKLTNIDDRDLIKIIARHKEVTFEECVKICVGLKTEFTQIFKVVNSNENELYSDEQIAYQCYKHVQRKIRSEDDDGMFNLYRQVEYTRSSIYEIFDSELTIDEMEYLRASLELYRRLNLRSD